MVVVAIESSVQVERDMLTMGAEGPRSMYAIGPKVSESVEKPTNTPGPGVTVGPEYDVRRDPSARTGYPWAATSTARSSVAASAASTPSRASPMNVPIRMS